MMIFGTGLRDAELQLREGWLNLDSLHDIVLAYLQCTILYSHRICIFATGMSIPFPSSHYHDSYSCLVVIICMAPLFIIGGELPQNPSGRLRQGQAAVRRLCLLTRQRIQSTTMQCPPSRSPCGYMKHPTVQMRWLAK